MDVTQCIICKFNFKHIMKHLARSPTCKEKYPAKVFEELRETCLKNARKRRNCKKRQNYHSESRAKLGEKQ